MTAGTADQLVEDYLTRLTELAAHLPADRRADLLEGIDEHLAAARAAGELRDEAATRTLLDRLGEPAELVAAAREDGPGSPPEPPSWGPEAVARPPGTGLETAAVLMLTAGSLLPVVGWLVGVVLLWSSRLWRTGEKLLATLVVPGGPGIVLVLAVLPVGTTTCSFPVAPQQVDSRPLVAVPGPPPAVPAPPLPPPLPPPGPLLPAPGAEQSVETCSSGLLPVPLAISLAVLALVAPVLVAVVLLRRARARAELTGPVAQPAGRPVGSPWGALEITAVVLLAVATLGAPVVGPLVGLVLACCSPRWSVPEKVVAACVVLLPAALLMLSYAVALLGSGGLGVGLAGVGTLFLASALASAVAAVYLAVVLTRSRPR